MSPGGGYTDDASVVEAETEGDASAAEAEDEAEAEEPTEEEEPEAEPEEEPAAEEESNSEETEKTEGKNFESADEESVDDIENELDDYTDEALQIISALDSDSDDVIQVQITGTYYQDDARSMLDMINEFRTGDDAWYWNSDNTTKTTCTGLSELKYDYGLERMAMIRAMEIAVYYSHERPNGTYYMHASEDVFETVIITGENIAAGFTSVDSVFAGWQESDKDYSGQGHRRTMLNSRYATVGIAHVIVNGCNYWVQEFHTSSTGYTNIADSSFTETASIDVLSSYITKSSVTSDVSSYFLQPGNSVSLPVLTTKISVKDSGLKTVSIPYTWKSSNTSCASISGSKLVAKSVGDATLSTTVLDTTITVPVTVSNQINLTQCTVSLSTSEYGYDGTAKKPTVTVKNQSGETLINGTDYTVTYSDNINAGTATVLVTGIGNYTGSVTKNFNIAKAGTRESSTNYVGTYDGNAHTFTLTVTGPSDYTVYYSTESALASKTKGTTTKPTLTNAGGVLVYYYIKDNTGNYSDNSGSAYIYIKPKVTATAYSGVYDGSSHSATITAAGKATLYYSTSTKLTYSNYSSSGSTTKPTRKEQGTTKVYYIAVPQSGIINANTVTTGTTSIVITSSSTAATLNTPTLSSVSNTTSGVKVSWKSVTGAAKYRVFRKTSGGSWAKVGDTTSTSYTDTTAKSGTTYTYTVRCINSAGTSYTSSYNTTGLSIKYLTAGKVSSLTNTSSGVTVKWSKVSGASGYYVYRKTSGGSYSKIATVTSGSTVSYSDTAVKSKNGTTYVYAVRPYSGSTLGSYTGKTTVRLTGVSISSLKNVKTKKMTVKWKKNSKTTGYQIQYSTSSDFSSYKTVTVSSYKTVSKTISSLTKGKKYYVRVRAYKTVSGTKYYSAWSSTKNVKISK